MASTAEWKQPSGLFIARLNPADVMTLVALAMCCVSLFLVATGRVYIGISVLLLAMLFDAFDGVVARKYGWEGPFGRYLDGFVDAFNYLAMPSIILWVCGADGLRHGLVMFVFIAAGLVRLSVFNMIGNIKVCGGMSYLGLPVFWSHFIIALLVGSKDFFQPWLWPWLVDSALIAMACAFLLNRPFWKPKSYVLMIGVILGLACVFAWKGL